MRVAFLVFNLAGPGGTSRSAISQANALAARGHDVEMVSVTRSAASRTTTSTRAVRTEFLVDVRGTTSTTRPARAAVAAGARPLGRPVLRCLRRRPGRHACPTSRRRAGHGHPRPAGRRRAAGRRPTSCSCTRSTAPPPTASSGLEPLLTFGPRADVVALLTDSRPPPGSPASSAPRPRASSCCPTRSRRASSRARDSTTP